MEFWEPKGKQVKNWVESLDHFVLTNSGYSRNVTSDSLKQQILIYKDLKEDRQEVKKMDFTQTFETSRILVAPKRRLTTFKGSWTGMSFGEGRLFGARELESALKIARRKSRIRHDFDTVQKYQILSDKYGFAVENRWARS